MSTWSPTWSPCEEPGIRKKTRNININSSNGGITCGPQITTTPCTRDCVLDINNSEWTDCKPDGKMYLTNTEIKVSPINATCVPTVTNCDFHCVMNDTVWNTCVNETGKQEGTRSTRHPNKNNGNTCGPTKDSRDCYVECGVSDWSAWSNDDSRGVRTRTRQQNYQARNGYDINGIFRVSPTCGPIIETQNYPVDCKYTLDPWHLFSCDKSNGVRSRVARVVSRELNGGSPCPTEIMTTDCPVDCEMGIWNYETSCIPSTGEITKSRTINVTPKKGGATCGPTRIADPCKVDCVMGVWSPWAGCVNNTTFRTRQINIYPKNGVDENNEFKTGATCSPTNQIEKCIDGPKILINTTGLIQTSGQNFVPNINFSIMRIEILGGGGMGGVSASWADSRERPVLAGGGGGGAGAYKDIRLVNNGLNDLIYTYNIGGDTTFNFNNKTYIALSGQNGQNAGYLYAGSGGLGGKIQSIEDNVIGTNGNNGGAGGSGLYNGGGGQGGATIFGTGGFDANNFRNARSPGSGGAGGSKADRFTYHPGAGAPGGIIISYYL
jgi:hypothetical protein